MNTREVALRLRFRRDRVQRFLSHLDLMRVFFKAFRRALLPLATRRTREFRPRLSLPYPLPLGVESRVEVIEAELDFALDLDDVAARLNRNLPEGLSILSVRHMPAGERRKLSGLEYEVEGDRLPEAGQLASFLASSTLTVERKKNNRQVSVNIRPFVKDLRRTDDGGLILDLIVEEGRSARPDEVLGLLGLDEDTVASLRMVRTGIRETGTGAA